MHTDRCVVNSCRCEAWADLLGEAGLMAGCAYIPAQLGLSHECRLSGGLRVLAAESLVHRLFHLPAAQQVRAGGGRVSVLQLEGRAASRWQQLAATAWLVRSSDKRAGLRGSLTL
jgi:hypothetical protein